MSCWERARESQRQRERVSEREREREREREIEREAEREAERERDLLLCSSGPPEQPLELFGSLRTTCPVFHFLRSETATNRLGHVLAGLVVDDCDVAQAILVVLLDPQVEQSAHQLHAEHPNSGEAVSAVCFGHKEVQRSHAEGRRLEWRHRRRSSGPTIGLAPPRVAHSSVAYTPVVSSSHRAPAARLRELAGENTPSSHSLLPPLAAVAISVQSRKRCRECQRGGPAPARLRGAVVSTATLPLTGGKGPSSRTVRRCKARWSHSYRSGAREWSRAF